MNEASPRPTAQRTVLVVDDQSAVRTSIAFFLEISGYRTFKAESGEAAMDLLRKERIDGVLMDVQMPTLNGFETSVRLHEIAREANRPVKIWFMTGISYRELKDDCAKAGGISVFQKPFDWPALLAEFERRLPGLPSFSRQDAVPSPSSAPA
ncbi:MAG TPA: response regulator [Lacunisphaera sp.]